MRKGQELRHVGGTNMNERSSRSHSIFRMVIESRERTNEPVKVTSRRSFEGGAVRVSCLVTFLFIKSYFIFFQFLEKNKQTKKKKIFFS